MNTNLTFFEILQRIPVIIGLLIIASFALVAIVVLLLSVLKRFGFSFSEIDEYRYAGKLSALAPCELDSLRDAANSGPDALRALAQKSSNPALSELANALANDPNPVEGLGRVEGLHTYREHLIGATANGSY